MSAGFTSKKSRILEQLAIPDQDYSDLSPKGSVDEPVRELVGEINQLEGFVTTSSCSGRIAVYLEGISKQSQQDDSLNELQSATGGIASGGKGGGQWLFVSHDPVDLSKHTDKTALSTLLGLPMADSVTFPKSSKAVRFVHLKYEPLILHVLTSSLSQAQQALSAALTSGFRESGISSITADGTVMVAVRTAGLAFDSIVAYADHEGQVHPMVTEEYLRMLVEVANERFITNSERKERFRTALLNPAGPVGKKGDVGTEWEPVDQRRERKRAEGLKRREEKERQAKQCDGVGESDKEDEVGTMTGDDLLQ